MLSTSNNNAFGYIITCYLIINNIMSINEFPGEDTNALDFSALLSSPESLFELLFY